MAPAILHFHIHHTVISRGCALRSFLFSFLLPSLGLPFYCVLTLTFVSVSLRSLLLPWLARAQAVNRRGLPTS